jgi:hypothetical protein
MRKTFGYQLYACGKTRPPEKIFLEGEKYRLTKVLKHDFFAATMLSPPEQPQLRPEGPVKIWQNRLYL